MTEETLEQRIDRLNQIARGDDDYADSQFELGWIYTEACNREKIEKAILHYNNIVQEDSKEIYAKAQFQLGWIFVEADHQKNIDKAIQHFNNIVRNDSEEFYNKAQFNLGWIFSSSEINKKDIDKAIYHYSNVDHNSSEEIYAQTQLNLGIIFATEEIKKDTIRAEKHFNNVNYTKNSFKIYVAAQILLLFKPYLIDKEEDNLNVIELICSIYTACLNIQNILLVNTKKNRYERTVAHYTHPAVLFALFKESSSFRLNLVDFMNDPSENRVLLNWLNIDPAQTNHNIKNFVASFSFNHHSLNQFRLYGIEDMLPGSGISITLKSSFFGTEKNDCIDYDIFNISPSNILTIGKKIVSKESEKTFPLPLYRCIYFDPDTHYLALAKRSKQSFYLENKSEKSNEIEKKWKEYIKSLDELKKIKFIREKLAKIEKETKQINNLILKNNWKNELKDINRLIALATMPIASLVKHAAFEDENECRLFYVTDIGNNKINIGESFSITKQIYINYTNIESHIDKIYLGPKCQIHHELWLKNHIKKNELNIRRIIKSTMPLQ